MTTPPVYPDQLQALQGAEPATGPIPTIGPERSIPANRSPRSWTPILLAVIGVLVIALGATTALWLSASNQLSAMTAEQAAVPDLRSVADKHLGDVTSVRGDSGSVSITLSGYDLITAEPGLESMLDELGFSSAVLDRMEKTRALDGTQEAEGRNCNVTWTYHPDDGLQMVFEAVHPS